MGRLYHGYIGSINNNTYRVELWNSSTADTPDSSIELVLASCNIKWAGEGKTTYESQIMPSRAVVGFTCTRRDTLVASQDVRTNLHNIALDAEQKWAVLIYKGSTLCFVGRVLADQISYERASPQSSIIEITAADALELISGYKVDSSWFTSGKITLTNLVSRILKTTGLVDFWTTAGTSSTFLCDATQYTNSAQTGTRKWGYNQVRLISFVANYDPFATDANIEYIDCKTALENVLRIYHAQIKLSSPSVSAAYWITQANAYDDTDFNYAIYDYNGNFVSDGNTLTHRTSISGDRTRPTWEAKPTISYQPPIREVDFEYTQQNGVLDARNKASASTSILDVTSDDIVPEGNKIRVIFDLSWDVPASASYTHFYQIRWRVWAYNPSNDHTFLWSEFKQQWDDFGAAYGSVNYTRLKYELTDWGTFGEKIIEKEYPAPPSGCTTVRASVYLWEFTTSVFTKTSTGTSWGTATDNIKAFSGFLRIEQAYDEDKWTNPVKTTSATEGTKALNSTVVKLDTSYYAGRKDDNGTIFVYNGSSYVPAVNWSAPWITGTDIPTGNQTIQQYAALSILGIYQDFVPTINGRWVDSGNYASVKHLYFDAGIWIFNGGTFDLHSERWDGEWLKVAGVYSSITNGGEGERIAPKQTDKNSDKIDILIGEVSRHSGALGDIGQVIIGDILNNGVGAPTSDPATDKTYTVQIEYDYSAQTMQWKVQPLSSNPWNEILKAADESKSLDASLTDDSKLTFSMLAYRIYSVRIKVPFYTTAAADFKVGLTGPTSPTSLNAQFIMIAPDGTQTQIADATWTNHSITSASNGNGFVNIDLTCETGSNAGTFAVQWAQNTSDASSTKVYAGAYLEYKETEIAGRYSMTADQGSFLLNVANINIGLSMSAGYGSFALTGQDATLTNPVTYTLTAAQGSFTLTGQNATFVAPDADATAFNTAAGITDATQKAAVNQLVLDLKAASIWSKLDAIYPFVGGSATSHKYNLKNPADSDAAFRISFAGGWTHASTGATPNGTTGEGNTHWIPNTDASTSSLSFGAYLRNDDKSGTYQIYGVFSTYFVQHNLSSDNMFSGSAGNLITTSNTTTKKLFVHSRTSTTQSNDYQDGSGIGSETTSVGGLPTIEFFLGSRNRGGYSDFFDGHEYAFAFLGDGLNGTEVTALTNAVNTFETTLSRNV